MNTNTPQQQLVELKKKIYKLESDLSSLNYQEEHAVVDYMESIRGRGITTAGAQPHINSIRREYSQKKLEVRENLNKTNYQYSILELESDTPISTISKRMSFDPQNGVLRCGQVEPHSFHRGNDGNKPLLCLFRKLWSERRYILKGVQKKAGEPFPPETLAVQVNVSKDKIISMLKSISRILQRFPAKIERENGILLIVTEK